MDEGGFIIDYIMPAGSSLTETDRVLQHVEAILRDNPNVEIISRRTGLQMGLAAVTEANSGDITVKLKAKRGQAIDEIISDVRAEIKSKEPELDIEFVQVLEDMINDLSNAPEPIQLKLFNNDPALLAQVGDEVATAIKKQKGVVDVLNGIENTVSGPSTTFRINPSIATRLGFTAQEVTTDASAIVEGVPVQNRIIQNGRPYTIRIRFGDDHRASFDAIQNTVLNSSTGKSATLGSVATIEHIAGEQEIRRENLQRNISVTGRLEGTDLGSGIQRVQAAVAALHIPPSVRIQYGGTYEEQQKSFAELERVLILALALVFGVLLAEFRNLSAPISILTSSILSMSGVVLALLVTGITFNVASFMGLIMVIGIVAKNGILLLDAYHKFLDIGIDPQRAMILAGRRRLRPILMTALAAIAGMLPLAFALGAGSQMLQPLAIAVIGGLAISMLLSLVVTPVMYLLMQGGVAAEAEES
jgi:multidrug efflux pump subunit AcrB